MRRYWVIVLLLGAAACTESGQDNGIASAGGGAAVTATRPAGVYDQQKWIKCLREQGLTVDDPNPSDPGGGKPNLHDELVSKEQLDAATKACQRYNTYFGQPAPPPDPAEVEKLRKFAQCVRDHGFEEDYPDPGAGGPSREPAAGRPTPSGPEFNNAIKECADRVPGAVAPDNGTKKEGK